MGDHDDRRAVLARALADQLQNLGLHGHVQRRGGLVGDQELGIAGQRDGDDDALAHAAGKFVGVLLHALLRAGDAHQPEQLHAPLPRVAPGALFVGDDALGDLRAHGEHRVHVGHGVLKDHADLVAPDAAQHIFVLPALRAAVLAHRRQLPAVKADAALLHAAILCDQAQAGQHAHALAGAALAHEAQNLALVHMEAHVAHRAHRSLAGGEGHAQLVYLQQSFSHQRLPLGFNAVSRPSPMKLREKMTMQITSTGQTICMG